MDSFKGKNRKEWHENYYAHGIKALESLTKDEIIGVLSRFCIGKEFVVPELKRSWRTLEELIEAEQALWLSGESLFLVLGEFIALDEYECEDATNAEMRHWLNTVHSNPYLISLGRDYLNFKK